MKEIVDMCKSLYREFDKLKKSKKYKVSLVYVNTRTLTGEISNWAFFLEAVWRNWRRHGRHRLDVYVDFEWNSKDFSYELVENVRDVLIPSLRDGSNEGLVFVERVFKYLRKVAYESHVKLFFDKHFNWDVDITAKHPDFKELEFSISLDGSLEEIEKRWRDWFMAVFGVWW